MNMPISSLDIERWYRFTKLDGTKIKLKVLGDRSLSDRNGIKHSPYDIDWNIPPEALESNINWPGDED